MVSNLIQSSTQQLETSAEQAAIAFSQMGDRLFSELAARMSTSYNYRLLFEHKLNSQHFQAIQTAAAAYISACLGSATLLSEQELVEQLLAARGSLPNYTGTGLLVPKREHILEFNNLHKSMVAAFSQLGANDLIDAVDLPINVRVVYGKTNPDNLRLPFTSSKLHSDVWAGVAPDATVVVLPLFGDIDHITIEAGEMPREMELGAMRVMSDFDEGRDIPQVISYSDAKLQHGTMYFNDARGLHQTVRYKSEGVRISIDFRFRRKFNEAYRAMVPLSSGGTEPDYGIPYKDWLKVGSDRLMVFDETLAQAQANRNTANPVPLYTKGYRLVDLFDWM